MKCCLREIFRVLFDTRKSRRNIFILAIKTFSLCWVPHASFHSNIVHLWVMVFSLKFSELSVNFVDV